MPSTPTDESGRDRKTPPVATASAKTKARADVRNVRREIFVRTIFVVTAWPVRTRWRSSNINPAD